MALPASGGKPKAAWGGALSLVSTRTTPALALAAAVSTLSTRPLPMAAPTMTPYSGGPWALISAEYSAAPVTLDQPSTRSTALPIRPPRLAAMMSEPSDTQGLPQQTPRQIDLVGVARQGP